MTEPVLCEQVVRAGQVPPPATVGHSCVYVVRRPDGAFYCGETDDLKSALGAEALCRNEDVVHQQSIA